MNRNLLAAGILAALAGQANAFRFDTSRDWEMRWDNTFKLNVMSRVARQDKDVITPRAGAGWFWLTTPTCLWIAAAGAW